MSASKKATTFKVVMRRIEAFEVEVTATDYSDAISVAQNRFHELPAKRLEKPYWQNLEVVQTGEPWVDVYWYDLHGPGDIVVGKRSIGNEFTAEDVELLDRRLRSLGLTVLDNWNGEGCDTVSFRCGGRKGREAFTAEQQAVLNAPRKS